MELINRKTFAVFSVSVLLSGICLGISVYATWQGHWPVLLIAFIGWLIFSNIADKNYNHLKSRIETRVKER